MSAAMSVASLTARGPGCCLQAAAHAVASASPSPTLCSLRSTGRPQLSSTSSLTGGRSALLRASGTAGGRGVRAPGRRSGHLCVAWQAETTGDRSSDDEDADYYRILGVATTASTGEIKRAYRKLAKEFHPDVSADESNTDFQVFLNQVYETLLDPETRMAYDAIAGFQVGGINPFMDTSYERNMAFVDEFACIGCKNCNSVCPSTFMMEDEYGRARVTEQGVDGVEKIQEAMDTCPVTCIHWVTAPQLALLEETMTRMERVGSWLLMSQGGKGANLSVFVEAATAWEKRQSALRSKVQAERGWDFFRGTGQAAGSAMQDSARAAAAAGGVGANSTLGRGVNAATVAASARRWRDYQRAKRHKETRLLSMTASSLDSVDSSEAALASTDVAS